MTKKQEAVDTTRVTQDPALQHIPLDTPLGKRVRRVFESPSGRVFTDADYSQMELNILAHWNMVQI